MGCAGRMTSTETPSPLIPGVHRVVRVLDPDEGPYAGSLVTNRGSVAVLVDVEAISGWDAWEHAGDEHVAAPMDIVRRHDGHGVLLPWCTERLGSFLGRRQVDGPDFSSGEVSTLVGSLLRGLDELAAEQGDGAVRGDWWLTEDGRPMFVIGSGEDAREGAARIVDRLHEDCRDRGLGRLLGTIRDGLRALGARPGAPRRQLELWEAELFATAAPRPLEREERTPTRVGDIDLVRTLRAAPAESRRRRRPPSAGYGDPQPESAVPRLLRIPAAVAAAARAWISAARTSLASGLSRGRASGELRRARWWGRRRSGHAPRLDGAAPMASRRPRLLLVGGAMAAAVLGVGLLWPGEATGEPDSGAGRGGAAIEQTAEATGSPAAEVPDGVGPPPEAPHGPTATPSADGDPGELDDPVSAAKALLVSIRDCATAGDDSCAGAVAEGSAGIVTMLGGGPSGASEPELVDRYGDIAVIRASVRDPAVAESVAERVVVLVRTTEKWLVRDAYDVADQPE